MKLITQNTTLAKELDRLCVEYDEFYWLTYNLDILCPYPERIKLLVTQCINGVDEKAKTRLDEAHQSFVESILNYYRTYCDTCFFWVRGKHQNGETASDEKSKFHSKLYLFRNSRNKLWEAIIGSFNYALGGLEIIQSSVLISQSDDPDGSMYEQIKTLISSTWKDNVYLSNENSTSNNKERYRLWFNHFNTVEHDRVNLPNESNYVTHRTVNTFHQELIPLWKLKEEVSNTDITLISIIESKSNEKRLEDSYKYSDGGILDKLIGDFVLSVDYIFTKEKYVLEKHKENKEQWEKHRKNWSKIVKYSTDILNGTSFELDILRHELDYFKSIMNPIVDEYYQYRGKESPAIIELYRSSGVIDKHIQNVDLIDSERIQFQKELLNTLTNVMFP